MRRASVLAFAIVALMALGEAVAQRHGTASPQAVLAADWPLHGRTEDGQRFSPLGQINRANVGRLGLAWWFDLQSDAGQEATPIMVGGILYVPEAYDVVHAIDARTGRALWSYDPGVRAAAARSCCGPVSRGVAVSDGQVFLGALDGRLIALDARTGKLRWQVQTLDQAHPAAVNYSITGAPRVIKGRVVIGNGGAEFGARGFVSAYDVRTGHRAWRFYTVPGRSGTIDHAASDGALATVAGSWAGEWWKWGGGGTVWDAIAYDPALNLIYIGTGNGSPTNYRQRSEAKGDNLFLASIVALDADTGRYVWHYQETPGESWDYTATQNIVFADIVIDGRPRKVLMQAPKPGFFYVIDRATGELISARPFADVTWATGVDRATGRPMVNPQARYYDAPGATMIFPSSGGAHNWPPMAFSRETGLVYIPMQDIGLPFAADPDPHPKDGVYNTGAAMTGGEAMDATTLAQVRRSMRSDLLAWDPAAGKAVWRHEMAAPFNGGVLATAGGLVIAGNAARQLAAYDARTGRALWSFDAGVGISAPPISYAIDGVQYVAVMAGYGGGWAMLGGQLALKAGSAMGRNRLLVFRLDGKARLPRRVAAGAAPPDPPREPASAAQIVRGDGLYGRYCLRCHGAAAISASFVPDLRHSGFLKGGLEAIVLGGALADQGMPAFKGTLNEADVASIRAYLVHRAETDRVGGRP